MYAPDPATHSHCTLGGMLGNNSCGIHSLLAAKHGRGLRTADNTHELDVLTYRGVRLRVGATPPAMLQRKVVRRRPLRRNIQPAKRLRGKYAKVIRDRFPQLPRRVSGYNLDAPLPENGFHVARSLVGSESTLVTILEATMNLVPNPAARSLLVLGYPDVYAAANDIMEILPLMPTGLEGMDHLLFKWTQEGRQRGGPALLPAGQGFLLVEFGGDSKEDSDQQARRCMEILRREGKPPEMKLFDDPTRRRDGLEGPGKRPGLDGLGAGPARYLAGLGGLGRAAGEGRRVPARAPARCSTSTTITLRCTGISARAASTAASASTCTRPKGSRRFRAFMDEAADLVVSLGGSLSGEHGDGQARGSICCPRCWAGADAGLPRVQGDLGPGRR